MKSSSENALRSGFTIIESAISLTVFVLLVTSLLSISIETSGFVTLNDIDMSTQLEADRTFARLADVLHKSGRVEIDGIVYPRVTNAGAGLEFRVLRDLDGNGYPFDQLTGELEWHPGVFEVRLDNENADLGVYQGGTKVYHLGRHVASVGFETIGEDSALHLREVRVSLETRRQTRDDFDIVRSKAGSIYVKH